jgi:hypothetical protein
MEVGTPISISIQIVWCHMFMDMNLPEEAGLTRKVEVAFRCEMPRGNEPGKIL